MRKYSGLIYKNEIHTSYCHSVQFIKDVEVLRSPFVNDAPVICECQIYLNSGFPLYMMMPVWKVKSQ